MNKRNFRQRFKAHEEATGYVAYVKATGTEPPNMTKVSADGPTFREVCERAKADGGKEGKWHEEKDHALKPRLTYVCETEIKRPQEEGGGRFKIGDLPVKSVRTPELRCLMRNLQKRPGLHKHKNKRLSNATINRYLRAASAVLTYAHQEELVPSVPKIPTLEEGPGREEWLTEERETAVRAVMVAKGQRVEAFLVHVFCETGLRVGELYGLKPEQVENEWINLKAVDTKTKNARRVWLKPELAKNLRAIIASNALPDAYQLLRKFKDACKVCEYSEELCLHSLRHTRATRLLIKGVNPLVVMKMLGWSSPKMLARYSHIADDLQREAAEKMSSQREESTQLSTVVAFDPEKLVV